MGLGMVDFGYVQHQHLMYGPIGTRFMLPLYLG